MDLLGIRPVISDSYLKSGRRDVRPEKELS